MQTLPALVRWLVPAALLTHGAPAIGMAQTATAPGDIEPEPPRLYHDATWPTLRLGLGSAWHGNGGGRQRLEIDVTAGARVRYSRRAGRDLTLLGEVGYSRHAGQRLGGHYFVAGAAALFGSFGGFGPGLYGVVGESDGQTAYGLRTVFMGEVLFGALGLELAHEWRRIGDVNDHMIRAMVTFRFEGLVAIAALAGADWTFE